MARGLAHNRKASANDAKVLRYAVMSGHLISVVAGGLDYVEAGYINTKPQGYAVLKTLVPAELGITTWKFSGPFCILEPAKLSLGSKVYTPAATRWEAWNQIRYPSTMAALSLPF